MLRGSPIRIGAVVAAGWLALTVPAAADPQLRPPTMVCGHVHVPLGSEKPVAGQAVHRKTNPQGRTYVFGTYSTAKGVRAVTQPTSAHTWFEGYAWSVLMCASSNRHVGWRFTGADGTFYALLMPEPPLRSSTHQRVRPACRPPHKNS